MKTFLIGCGVLCSVLCAPASAQPRWTMLETGTLVVIGDLPPKTLREIAIEMEHFRDVVGSVFTDARRTPALPTVVYAFSSRSAMRPFLPITNGKPADVAGLMSSDGITNRILISADEREQAFPIAFHEYTHLLTANTGNHVPVWLNEGLAEYFSTFALIDGGKGADIGRPIPHHVGFLRQRWLPLPEMLGVQNSSELYHESTQRQLLYPEAWALVHYVMTQRKDSSSVINGYVNAVAAGTPSGEALSTALGLPLDRMNEELRRYVRREIFTLRRYTFNERIARTVPTAPRPLSQAEAEAWLGDLQRAVRRLDEASVRIEAAARDVNLPMAQVALGHLRLAQNRQPDAEAAFARAVELAPDDFAIQMASALAILRGGAAGGYAAAITPLRRAAGLRPDSAETHGMLAFALMAMPESLAEAEAAVQRAMTLSPSLEHRLRFAEILLRQGKYDGARGLLRALSIQQADPAIAKAAAALVRQLEGYDRQVAEARIAAEARAAAADRAAVSAGAAAATGAATGPSTADTPTEPLRAFGRGARFVFTPVAPGEERLFGRLIQVECGAGGDLRFHVIVDGKPVVATARQWSQVDLVQYRTTTESTLNCGVRPRPDVIFLTWKRGASPATGTAVRLAFMPDDFVP